MDYSSHHLGTVSDNPQSLFAIFGHGHLAINVGGSVNVTRCAPVEVIPRSNKNCIEEILAVYKGMEVFLDPISYVIKSARSPVNCSDKRLKDD
jgi:hypothetical protein